MMHHDCQGREDAGIAGYREGDEHHAELANRREGQHAIQIKCAPGSQFTSGNPENAKHQQHGQRLRLMENQDQQTHDDQQRQLGDHTCKQRRYPAGCRCINLRHPHIDREEFSLDAKSNQHQHKGSETLQVIEFFRRQLRKLRQVQRARCLVDQRNTGKRKRGAETTDHKIAQCRRKTARCSPAGDESV